MRARWAWAVACAGLLLAMPKLAEASDFWDAVRGAPKGLGDSSKRLGQARASLGAGRADDAVAELAPILASAHGGGSNEKAVAEAWLVTGRAQLAIGATTEALTSFERALVALGDRPVRLEEDALAVAVLALRTQRFALAARAVLGRADKAPTPTKRAGWHALHGHVLQATGAGALEQAVAAYRAALLAVPDHAPALLGLALAMHRQGDEQAALAIARRVRDPALIEHGLLESLQPRGERSARVALWRQSIDDTAAAKAAWQAAAFEPGPWQEHARSSLGRAFPP